MKKREFKTMMAALLSFVLIFSNLYGGRVLAAEASSVTGLEDVQMNLTVFDNLDFNPTDTVMDENQPILYMTDYSRKQVVAYNYETKVKKVIQFQLQPENLFLSKGVLYVALLKGPHNSQNFGAQTGAIGIIDISTFMTAIPTAKEIFDVDTDPYDMTVDPYGYIYISSGSGQATTLNSYNLQSKQKVSSSPIYQQNRILMNPQFDKIYAVNDLLYAYTFSSGVLQRVEDEDSGNRDRAPFRISPDGKNIFASEGSVFTSFPQAQGDMMMVKKFYRDTAAKDITFNFDNRLVYEAMDTLIKIYDYDTLTEFKKYNENQSISSINYKSQNHLQRIFYRNGKLIAITKDEVGRGHVEKVSIQDIGKPLVLLNSDVKDNTMNVPLIQEITLTFNQEIHLVNANGIDFFGGNPLPKTSTVNGNKLTIHFDTPMQYGSPYSVAIRKGSISGLNGMNLTEDLIIKFATGSSNTLPQGKKEFAVARERITGNKVIDGDLIVNGGGMLIVDKDASLTIKGNLIIYGALYNYGNVNIQGNLYSKYTKDTLRPGSYNWVYSFVNMKDATVKGMTSSEYPLPMIVTNPESDLTVEKDQVLVNISTYPDASISVNGGQSEITESGREGIWVPLKSGKNDITIKAVYNYKTIVEKKFTIESTYQPPPPPKPVAIQAISPSDLQEELMPINTAVVLKIDTSRIEQYATGKGIQLIDDSTGKSTPITFNAVNGEDSSKPSLLSITPTTDLHYDQSYTLTISYDSILGKDRAVLDKDYVIKFKTDKQFKRLGGTSRFETSIKISQEGWKQADSVVLATGNDFPDALSAAPLAKKYGAPILLTDSSGLSTGILEEIKRLGAKKVYLIGGYGAISQDIEETLTSNGLVCKRLKGQNRYETAVAIAKEMGASEKIVLATGKDFPDALSIAPFAAAEQTPILLTTANELPQSVKQYIQDSGVKETTIVGGTAAVSTAVEKQLPKATRLSGKNRYETNFEIINAKNADGTYTFFATGDNFPDALAGSAFSCYFSSPIILVNSQMDSEIQETWKANKNTMKMKYILGGSGALPGETVYQIFN